MSDISDAIEDVAAGPRQTTVDGQTVLEHTLGDLIAADQYLDEKTARGRSRLPIRIAQLKPPGAV